tara:strand:- start:620 stop:1558 length:939 start_codon:yes stop_codon:yes gene_type:complete
MQTRTYGNLFKLIKALAGVDSFIGTENNHIAEFINRRYSKAYNTSPSWPRYLVVSESRRILSYTLLGAGDNTSTTINQNYRLLGVDASSNNVYQGETTTTVIIYKNDSNAWRIDTAASASEGSDGTFTVSEGTQQFIEADVTKKNKLEDVETFTPTSGSDILIVQPKNLISYTQSGKETIGEFVRLHRKRAFLNHSRVEYDFYVDSSGANILDVASNQDKVAFVTYKKPLTLFTVSADYEDSTVEVPSEFFNYLAHSTYADFLRMDGQHGKAIAEEKIAEDYLFSELEKIDIRSNNNSLNKKFSTYVNRQSR